MYIIAEGNLPIVLIAHMDTVFNQPPKNIFYDPAETVLWSPSGLGADDRAGIYAIISLINDGFRPSVIFTNLEEQGGIGANKLVEDYPDCPFSNCKALIELDRRGSEDCVFYDCDNKDFENLINLYDFKTDIGSFTDISFIMSTWKIAGVNLSVGYYFEHQPIEILNTSHLDYTIERVRSMLIDCNEWQSYSYIPAINGIEKCACCGNPLKILEGMIWNAGSEEDPQYVTLCDNCYKTFIL